ncbi:hypothetical protein MRX96_051452 [Rhipicephalus microplus]
MHRAHFWELGTMGHICHGFPPIATRLSFHKMRAIERELYLQRHLFAIQLSLMITGKCIALFLISKCTGPALCLFTPGLLLGDTILSFMSFLLSLPPSVGLWLGLTCQ